MGEGSKAEPERAVEQEATREYAEPSADGKNVLGNIKDSAVETFDSFRHPLSKDGVFTSVIKTVTGKNAYEIENAERAFKLLGPKNMDQTIALAGLKPGVHQHVVRGDSVYHYLQKRFNYIDGDDFQFIQGIQREETTGNATFVYSADRRLTVGHDDDFSVNNRQDTFVLGKSTHQFVGKHEVTAPEEFEWKQFERGFSALKLDMATFVLDIHLSEADVHGIDVELIGAETRTVTASDINKAMKVQLRILLLAAALELAIVGRLNGAPDVGLGTPLR